MKFFPKILLLILVALSSSCTINTQLGNLEKEPSEAIIGGKLHIFYNGTDVTSQASILFNEIMMGTYNYKPDSTAYIITKLPAGSCHLSRVMYTNFFYNLEKEITEFLLPNGNRINYIGDITINWSGPKTKISGMFGAVGAILDEMSNDGDMVLYVEDNFADFKEYFNHRYHGDHKFNRIALNLPAPDSLFTRQVEIGYTENPKYLTFKLTKDRSCKGNLRMIKKKDVYVEAVGETGNKVLYVFKKKDLISVMDFEGNDVTEKTMQSTDFERINYNRYETILM